MMLSFNNIAAMIIPVVISFYTLSYALWLVGKKQKWAAFGTAFLAVLAILYPGYVLFYIHGQF